MSERTLCRVVPKSRLFLSLVLCLFLGEGAVRLIGHADVDGNLTLRGYRIPPHRFPGTRLAALLDGPGRENYLEHSPELGWRPRPGAISANGFYAYDELAVRVADPSAPTALEPAPSVRRVVIVGDSFAHGDDVHFAESLGARLASALAIGGDAHEVVNLAVGGFGMDQAYLRLRAEGLALSPDIVLFGFQVENVHRNRNVLRGYYHWKTGIPFSKPRFLLGPDGLQLVNQPVVPLEELPGVLRAGGTPALLAHEAFFDPGLHASSFVRRSRLYGAVEAVLRGLGGGPSTAAGDLSPSGEVGALALAILRAAREEVQDAGARFVVLRLPNRKELAGRREGRRGAAVSLLEVLGEEFEIIDPTRALLGAWERVGPEGLFTRSMGHYSGAGNEVVARVVAGALGS